MALIIVQVCCQPPRGGCGLKLDFKEFFAVFIQVSLHAGAVDCNPERVLGYTSEGGQPPRGGCGLKYSCL